MAAPPSASSSANKSRGHSLFDRQAQLHAHDPNKPFNPTFSDTPLPLPPLKSAHSISSQPMPTSSVTHQHHQYSPSLMHRRSPLSTTESYAHPDDNNVQLLSVHPRPEVNYIQEVSPPSPVSLKLQETDFPLYEEPSTEELDKLTYENLIPNDSTYTADVEKAFDYLSTHDDDDDVIHRENNCEYEYRNDSFDDEEENNSINTNDLDLTTGIHHHHQNDSKFSFI
jgi:hypothetical protein